MLVLLFLCVVIVIGVGCWWWCCGGSLLLPRVLLLVLVWWVSIYVYCSKQVVSYITVRCKHTESQVERSSFV